MSACERVSERVSECVRECVRVSECAFVSVCECM
jgi:hypothetical protein